MVSLMRAAGFDTVVWTAWGHDWQDDPSEVVARRAVRSARPGGVLLLHDGYFPDDLAPTLARPTHDKGELVTKVLSRLSDDGLRPMAVSELVSGRAIRRVFWL